MITIRSSKDGRNVTIVEWSGCCGQLVDLSSEKPPPVVFAQKYESVETNGTMHDTTEDTTDEWRFELVTLALTGLAIRLLDRSFVGPFVCLLLGLFVVDAIVGQFAFGFLRRHCHCAYLRRL